METKEKIESKPSKTVTEENTISKETTAFEIILTSLYHIKLDLASPIKKNISDDAAKEYIPDLIKKILSSKNIRQYYSSSHTTQVIGHILKIISSIETYLEASFTGQANISLYDNDFSTIANRLHEKQLAAEKRIHHMDKEVTKGSLIQSLLKYDSKMIFLLALVDHNKFLDEDELKNKEGLSYDKAALKACLIYFDTDNSIEKICITDTSNNVAKYWYSDFLDLKETKDDTTNTEYTYKAFKSVINDSLKRISPSDCTTLKTALNSYFVQNKTFKFDDCIKFVFDEYTPISDSVNIENLKSKINKIASKGLFDTHFTIEPSRIRNLLNAEYKLNKNLTLKINKDIDKLEENICTIKHNETLGVFIKKVDKTMLDKFNFGNLEY
jgi:hypothetical protein